MKIAIVIPCYNEEQTIAQVVTDCINTLPAAQVFVFDNNSTDRTSEVAKAAGAMTIHSPIQGKGAVVQHALRMVQADYIVMLDGDNTYPAKDIPKLIHYAEKNNYDMVVGTRLESFAQEAFRKKHHFGNRLFSKFASFIFGHQVSDIFSGFRVFTKDFAKSIHLSSRGFEIESELTLQAISQGWRLGEIPIHYKNRPTGSYSKLNTYRDGFLILRFIFMIIRDYKPLSFFSTLATLCFFGGLLTGWAPIRDFVEYSYVFTVPRAILAASLMILSSVLLGVGLILDSQMRYFLRQVHLLKNYTRDAETVVANEQKSMRILKP